MENNTHKANWVWTVLLVGLAAYLHWIVVGLHIETSRLSEDREALSAQSEEFRVGLEARTEEIARFQSSFRADIQEATKNLRKVLRKDDTENIFDTSTSLSASTSTSLGVNISTMLPSMLLRAGGVNPEPSGREFFENELFRTIEPPGIE